MAENDQREIHHHRNQEAEITSEENPIEEDELELSLGLRPIHPRPRTTAISGRNFPEFSDSNSNPNPNPTTPFSKRDAQAFRRQEAKKKRDLKRKANNNNDRAWVGVEERDGNSGDSPTAEDAGGCRKVAKLNNSYWAPSSWWSWNPASGGGFRPYQGQNGKISPGGQNVDGETRQSISSGNSSGISDSYQSTSGPGGTSSDVGSHSSHPYSQTSPPAIPTANSPQVQACSTQAELQPNGSIANGSLPKLCNFSSTQIEHLMSSGQPPMSPAAVATAPNSIPRTQTSVEDGPLADKGRVPTTQTPSPKEIKVETGKPPKPTGPTNQEKLMLAQMPCVSVTGNGPNGKTITGFLYTYTKAEVSIVCVCHGASFSPAGFVEHAGGVDVEHPLRHIRVVPFALG